MFSGRWLIGADGANSIIRKLSSISFQGFTWTERFLVISTKFKFEKVLTDLSSVNYFADPVLWFFLLKVPGLWRVMFPFQSDEKNLSEFTKDQIEMKLKWVYPKGKDFDISHTTLYNVHQRVASVYRKNRIFLAGDAAHINNPLGGMGMNGGIHDAFNLAEKLAAVWHNEQSERLLNFYEKQRRAVALEYVNKKSIKNKENLEAKEPEDQKKFRSFLMDLMQSDNKTRDYLMEVSMLSSLKTAKGFKL